MAKYGKFVTKKSLVLNNQEIKKFRQVVLDVLKNYRRLDGRHSWTLEWSDYKYANTLLTYKIKLSIPIKRVNDITSKGCFAHDISQLWIHLYKSSGVLEDTGERMKQYEIYCGTDGKYHVYRTHYDRDYAFEGKHHFNYDTDIEGFREDLADWLQNVTRGINV